MRTFGVALLGAGRIGRVHAASLAAMPGVRVLAVVDANLQAADEVRQVVWAERISTDVDEVIHDPAIDAVLIATPTTTHADLIEIAARAGKAVFCEKPVALSLERTRQVLRTVEETGVAFQIGFQRRFDAGYAQAHQALGEGAVGKVEMFRAVGRDPMSPPLSYLPTSGGMFVDMAIHDYDLARFLVGEVVEVQAWGEVLTDPAYRDFGDVDTSITFLRFANGALGVVENSRRAVYGYDIRTEIFGSRGKLVVDAVPKTPVWRFGERGISADHYYYFTDRFRDAYRREIEAFFEALRQERSPTPGPDDALEALRIGVAATLSFRERRPVRIEELT